MGTPSDYLPPALSSDQVTQHIESLGLPTPSSVRTLQVPAQFHSIYIINYAKDRAISVLSAYPGLKGESDGSLDLVLRVSGLHLPRIKTLNEVGVMTWVKENTTIPVPLIVRYDASEDNLLHHEFTLLEKCRGVSVDKIYDTLSQAAKENLVSQLIDYLVQLHSKQWTEGFVGGLILDEQEKVAKGSIVDEYFWQVPDIMKLWPDSETVESLNPVAAEGYPTYTAFISASVTKYTHAISVHDSLSSFRDLIPRLDAFRNTISSPETASALNNVRYILAHKDLHFANIMCDPTNPTPKITAILDWEFSSVVPAPRWNPPRAFLWNAQNNEESKTEQAALEQVFERMCRQKGYGFLLEDVKVKGLQEQMQTLTNFLRAIVEVCPRGQAGDRVQGWRETVETCMDAFGV